MPKVSAIIPVFNGERFIKDSIESILEQTFNEVEIIVIDDGSTDRTKEFVQSFGQKVIYRRQANAGADKAYNHGISLASGDYVAFLDHDDRIKRSSHLVIIPSRHKKRMSRGARLRRRDRMRLHGRRRSQRCGRRTSRSIWVTRLESPP